MTHSEWFGTDRPIIGMVHLDSLPGAPGATAGLSAVREAAVRDANRLVAGGVDGLLIENYGDTRSTPSRCPNTLWRR